MEFTILDKHTETRIPREDPRLYSFAVGYITAAIWTLGEEEGEAYEGVFPCYGKFSWLDDTAIAGMVADCRRFITETLPLWDGKETDETAGIAFWLTRNRHGSGFWDSPDVWGEAEALSLTTIAHAFGECELMYDGGGFLSLFPVPALVDWEG